MIDFRWLRFDWDLIGKGVKVPEDLILWFMLGYGSMSGDTIGIIRKGIIFNFDLLRFNINECEFKARFHFFIPIKELDGRVQPSQT